MLIERCIRGVRIRLNESTVLADASAQASEYIRSNSSESVQFGSNTSGAIRALLTPHVNPFWRQGLE